MKIWQREWFPAVCVGGGAILLVLFVCLLCDHLALPKATPQFQVGQMVTIKLTQAPGQIISGYWWSGSERGWQYLVRVAGRQVRTQTHLLSPDGPLVTEPLASRMLWEWELESRTERNP